MERPFLVSSVLVSLVFIMWVTTGGGGSWRMTTTGSSEFLATTSRREKTQNQNAGDAGLEAHPKPLDQALLIQHEDHGESPRLLVAQVEPIVITCQEQNSSALLLNASVEFVGRPSLLTTAEIEVLQDAFVETYNGLTPSACPTPSFRMMINNTLTNNNVVTPGDMTTLRFQLLLRATVFCRGCDETNSGLLFSGQSDIITTRNRLLQGQNFTLETCPACPPPSAQTFTADLNSLVVTLKSNGTLTSVDSVNGDVVQVEDVTCADNITEFTTTVFVDFLLNEGVIPTPQDIMDLEEGFVTSYNDINTLDLESCDFFFRRLVNATIVNQDATFNRRQLMVDQTSPLILQFNMTNTSSAPSTSPSLSPTFPVTFLPLFRASSLYQYQVSGSCRGCPSDDSIFDDGFRRRLSRYMQERKQNRDKMTGNQENKKRIGRALQTSTNDDCVCGLEPMNFRAPTREEFTVSYDSTIAEQMIPFVQQVQEVFEVDAVDCPMNISNFTTTVFLDFVGDADGVSGPNERSLLAAAFAEAYNGLTDSFCDPFFRTVLMADVADVINITNFTDAQNTFTVVYDVLGRCRGCPEDSSLFDAGVATTDATDSTSGRRVRQLLQSNHRQYIDEFFPDVITHTHRRRVEQMEVCFCDTTFLDVRNPTEEEFAAEYRTVISQLPLFNSANSTFVFLGVDEPSPPCNISLAQVECCVAADCGSGFACTEISRTCVQDGALRFTVEWTGDDTITLEVTAPDGTVSSSASTNTTRKLQQGNGNTASVIYPGMPPTGLYSYEIIAIMNGFGSNPWRLGISSQGTQVMTQTGIGDSGLLTFELTEQPSMIPSLQPSQFPSLLPSQSFEPTGPTTSPSFIPSNIPSMSSQPSDTFSEFPSGIPSHSIEPSDEPSLSLRPSDIDALLPSANPSESIPPSNLPSLLNAPSLVPSVVPSISLEPSETPTTAPSESSAPSESATPTASPSVTPSTTMPSQLPSTTPSFVPSETQSASPSTVPSESPSMMPTNIPSSAPSPRPSETPSSVPSSSPSEAPSYASSESPSESIIPSFMPSSGPSDSTLPSFMPSSGPSTIPSSMPSSSPSNSTLPSFMPSSSPSTIPSFMPSSAPSYSTIPSFMPSSGPSDSTIPSLMPSSGPSTIPSFMPSSSPSAIPSFMPSSGPSIIPSFMPSSGPSDSTLPSFMPSSSPSIIPSFMPSSSPSIIPSFMPSSGPSTIPSFMPSSSPSTIPSFMPSSSPSDSTIPSPMPSSGPSDSTIPSFMPSLNPSQSLEPSLTIVPTKMPSRPVLAGS